MNIITKGLCKFIPKHISNKAIIGWMQFFRKLQRHGNMYALRHADDGADLHLIGFIENQKELDGLYLGLASIADCGCEVIACHNALNGLGLRSTSFAKLTAMFEKDGIIHSGRWGVSPVAIADVLKTFTDQVTMHIAENKDLGSICEEIEAWKYPKKKALIVTYYNNKENLAEEIHTICITRGPNGYVGHNVYLNGSILGPFVRLDELLTSINDGNIKIISYIEAVR